MNVQASGFELPELVWLCGAPQPVVLSLWITWGEVLRPIPCCSLNSVFWRGSGAHPATGFTYGSVGLVGISHLRTDLHAGAPVFRRPQFRHLLQHAASR